MKGFRDSQCREEHFKSLLLSSSESQIYMAEDNNCFRGNLRPLLASCYVDTANEINHFDLKDEFIGNFDVAKFKNIYDAYVKVSKDDFEEIWGDLICTDIYYHSKYSGRLYINRDVDYKKFGAIIEFSKRFASSKFVNAIDFSINIEKEFVRLIKNQYDDLRTIRNVREQLYLLYIITRRICKKDNNSFFKNSYNFGWLYRETGFSSLFNKGIEGDPLFSVINPIFQTYYAQFRYNMGLYSEHAIDIEIGSRPKYHLLDKVVEWANEQ